MKDFADLFLIQVFETKVTKSSNSYSD